VPRLRSIGRHLHRSLYKALTPARPRPVILMYHRIINLPFDPWGLAVSPENFASQLDHLRQTRDFLDLASFTKRLADGSVPANAIAVSFDDGYVDNLCNAEPILTSAGIPATLFLTTANVGGSESFWWDELAELIFNSFEAVDLRIKITGSDYRLRLGQLESKDFQSRGWRAGDKPRTAREAAYLAFWRAIRVLPPDERVRVMVSLRRALRTSKTDRGDRSMSITELRGLAERGTFAFGGHTVTHPFLPTLSLDEQRGEIAVGKLEAEAFTGQSINGFAYPYGAMDSGAKQSVIDCGFQWACSTKPSSIDVKSYDLFALPRISVPNGDGNALEQLLHRV
jgi:peptidoglycan/xylan/chitin deacetylase (PgdA/CDA1 family)